jgi:Protein of unknown function (DUF3124)
MANSNQNLRYWQIWILSHPWILLGLIAILVLGVPIGLVLYLDHQIARFANATNDPRPPHEPTGAMPGQLPREIVVGQTVYVPLYSHVYQANGERLMLAGTLSIRNTDADHALTISGVRYYDTEGKLVRDFLKTPLTLKPLGSTDFLVQESDTSGGSGANFLVEWVSDEPVQEPIIEAVMVGRKGGSVAAFARSGVVTKQIRPPRLEQ